MTLDEVLKSLFPAGHDVKTSAAGLITGTGKRKSGGPITVNGDGIWAAWQDGDGPWLPLEKSNQKFTFRPSGTRYAVAVVCPVEDGSKSQYGSVFYQTTSTKSFDVCLFGGEASCGEAFYGTVKGTLSNVGTSQWLKLNDWTNGRAISPAAGNATYSIGVDFIRDLVFGIAPSATQPLTRIAVLRDAVTEASSDPATVNVDFNTAGKPTTVKSITINGLEASDTQTHQVLWSPQNSAFVCQTGGLLVSTNGASASDSYAALDPALVHADEYYSFTLGAGRGTDSSSGASVSASFKTPQDLAIPVAFTDARASLVATAPFLRVEASFSPFPDATGYSLSTRCKLTGGSSIDWSLGASPEWLGTCTDCKISMPAFSPATCWDDAWACPAGSAFSATVYISSSSNTADLKMNRSATRRVLQIDP